MSAGPDKVAAGDFSLQRSWVYIGRWFVLG